jgi:hypothetical protein
VEWLFDDFFRNHKNKKPKILEINYLGEVFEGATVQLFSQQLDNEVIYVVKNKEAGREVCRAKLGL